MSYNNMSKTKLSRLSQFISRIKKYMKMKSSDSMYFIKSENGFTDTRIINYMDMQKLNFNKSRF